MGLRLISLIWFDYLDNSHWVIVHNLRGDIYIYMYIDIYIYIERERDIDIDIG